MENTVADTLNFAEKKLNNDLAQKALGIVKPMITDSFNEVHSYVSDPGKEKIVLIQATSKLHPLSLIVLDKYADFTVKGAAANNGKFSFSGASIDVDGKKRLQAILKYFTVEEFIELLLSGKMKELHEKLRS